MIEEDGLARTLGNFDLVMNFQQAHAGQGHDICYFILEGSLMMSPSTANTPLP